MVNGDRYVLGIDAGGTFFKSLIVSESGGILPGSALSVKANSDKDAESVRSAYESIIKQSKDIAEKAGVELCGICVDTPGPFDYEAGMSLMKHKFQAIYGIPLRPWLSAALGKDVPICFLHDSASFILGEMWHSKVSDMKNVAGVMLGTGLGFALYLDGKLRIRENGNPLVSLWNVPFEDGIAEDKVSGRGIIATYKKLCGEANVSFPEDIDCKTIGRFADEGDALGIKAYEYTAECLAKVLLPVLCEHQVECLILGGQISRSFNVMEKKLREGLAGCASLKVIAASDRIDNGHILGVSSYFFSKY